MKLRVIFLFLLVLIPQTLLAQTLRVGLSPDYPPLQYKEGDQLVGIEVDNARAIGKITGLDIELVELPMPELLPALAAGKLDVVMSGLSITDEREQQVAFTESYLTVGQMAILAVEKAATFGQPWSIYRPGVKVGVEPETTGAAFVEEQLDEAQVSFYEDPEAAFAGLRSGAIDVYIHDAPTSWRLANHFGTDDLISQYHPLTEEELAWAVRKDDPMLRARLNDALRTMRNQGTLEYILNRWIPVRVEVE